MSAIAEQIKERPILFSAPMVRAILDGRKTQTRRIWKHYQPMANLDPDTFKRACPYGVPRDHLWVRETFSKEADGRLVYRSDKSAIYSTSGKIRGSLFYLPSDYEPIRWRPSIFMPRWASRITLEIVSVRVERLRDISERDAKAEGVCETCNCLDAVIITSTDHYRRLWDSINGKTHPWSSNPWVWVIEFRRIKP